jgi:hypothetical protein
MLASRAVSGNRVLRRVGLSQETPSGPAAGATAKRGPVDASTGPRPYPSGSSPGELLRRLLLLVLPSRQGEAGTPVGPELRGHGSRDGELVARDETPAGASDESHGIPPSIVHGRRFVVGRELQSPCCITLRILRCGVSGPASPSGLLIPPVRPARYRKGKPGTATGPSHPSTPPVPGGPRPTPSPPHPSLHPSALAGRPLSNPIPHLLCVRPYGWDVGRIQGVAGEGRCRVRGAPGGTEEPGTALCGSPGGRVLRGGRRGPSPPLCALPTPHAYL